tara:strand:- start:507 stop:1475 length:969 start_codon:yes stop_codon:yes gene_type:complete
MRLLQFARTAMVAIGSSLAIAVWAAGEPPLKIIVPAPPGGTMDIVGRLVGQQMSVDTGRTVIVENRAGAVGSIGMRTMLQAPPDGNTILMGAINLLVEAPQLMKVPYDPLADIVSIARVASTSYVLVTAANYPTKDFQGLVTHLKTRKGKANFASYGRGTVSQYSGFILSDKADLDMQHVGYAGSPPALQDVIGGQVDIMFDGLATSLPLIKGERLRAYAVAGKKRSSYLPDVPTMTELGYPEIQYNGQVTFYGSSKLPADVLAKLQETIKKAAEAPAVQKKLIDAGLEPDVSVDSAAMLAESRLLYQRNAGIVKKFNIQAN